MNTYSGSVKIMLYELDYLFVRHNEKQTYAIRDSLMFDSGHHLYLDVFVYFILGVGVVINMRWSLYSWKVQRIHDRFITVDLKFGKRRTK